MDVAAVMSMVNTLAPVIGTLFTNNASSKASIRENAKSRQFARESSDIAFQRQMDAWRQENEYNSPLNQMQRYLAAGLNPNLIYSQGQTPSPVPTVASAQNQVSHVPNYQNPLSTDNLLAAKLAEAQIRNLDADTDKKDAETNMTYQEIWRITQMTPAEVDKMRAESDRIQQLIASDEFQVAVNQEKFKMFQGHSGEYEIAMVDGQGNEHKLSFDVEDFQKLVIDSEITNLIGSQYETKLMFAKFADEIGLIKDERRSIQLKNQDMEEFVKVCARIYESEASEADLVTLLSQGNKNFWENFGGQSDLVKAIASFLMIFAKGITAKRPVIQQ